MQQNISKLSPLNLMFDFPSPHCFINTFHHTMSCISYHYLINADEQKEKIHHAVSSVYNYKWKAEVTFFQAQKANSCKNWSLVLGKVGHLLERIFLGPEDSTSLFDASFIKDSFSSMEHYPLIFNYFMGFRHAFANHYISTIRYI